MKLPKFVRMRRDLTLMTFLASECVFDHGQAYPARRLFDQFERWCDQAGLGCCLPYHDFVRKLRTNGVRVRDGMAIGLLPKDYTPPVRNTSDVWLQPHDEYPPQKQYGPLIQDRGID